MDTQSIFLREWLIRYNAWIEPNGEHFVTRSGKHTPVFVDMERIANNPEALWEFSSAFVEEHAKALKRATVIIGVETGGVRFAEKVTQILHQYHGGAHQCVTAQKGPNKTFHFNRKDSDAVKYGTSFIIDDAGTSGSAIRSVLETTQTFQAKVIGVGVILDRSGLSHEDMEGIPFFSLGLVKIPLYDPWDCRLCAKYGINSIRVDLGHGASFRDEYPSYSLTTELLGYKRAA